VRALHLVTASNDLEEVKAIMLKVYQAKANSLPFGVRLRFAHWIFFFVENMYT
jgi:hypothetical protein